MKVLFITGFGRSGTTILDNIVGAMEGFFSIGEAQYVWDRSGQNNLLCGCGEAVQSCPVWKEVLPRTLAGLTVEDLARLTTLREGLGPTKALRLDGRTPDRTPPELTEYIDRTRRFLETTAEVTGARVLVDSSKSPSQGYVLARIPGVELTTVHLVRDPRAVAYAWQKVKVYNPDGGDDPMMMTRHPPRRSALLWNKWNLAAELMGRRRHRYLRLRYEDFTADPQGTVRQILALMGESDTPIPFEDSHTVRLGTNHSLAGNPSRFRTGAVAIRPDDTWRQALAGRSKVLVTALTWPLLLRYGYPLGSP